ncbi:MAG: GtrA family protein [Butyrivibrio sp.]|nr:GtrA family protein [Butyrivibrio sp.]
MQFVKFGIVGVSNTVISYVLYTVALLAMRSLHIFASADYLIATVIAFILSVLWSFYWNNKMVFVMKEGQRRNLWKALIKTYISYSFTGLFLNSILMVLWVQIFHISEFIAPIINLLISVPVNFIINKFWAFKSE